MTLTCPTALGVAIATCVTAEVTVRPPGVRTSSMAVPSYLGRSSPNATASAELVASGLGDISGSAVGPDGRLYITHGSTGRISRVNPETGNAAVFASGLPPSVIGLGGVMDVAFIDQTAYALVTLVGPDVGGTSVGGIYRVDAPSSFTVIADIAQFAVTNPPRTPFDVPSGLQFALQHYRGGFLVTDGHHNRVLRVALDGRISELVGFDNIVPTGIDVSGNRIYLAQAGPVPHAPENGKVVLVDPKQGIATEVAAGARLLVDVEVKGNRSLYALSQGLFPEGSPPATPALPNTGSLVKSNWDGTFDVVVDYLDRPISLELIGNTAYIATLGGEIWKVDLRGSD